MERELGEDIRRIMREEETGLPEKEEGPQLFPGLTDEGIGSAIFDEEDYDEEAYDEEDDLLLIDEDLLEEPDGEIKESAGRKRKKNGSYLFISIAFGILFLMLIGHLIYFHVKLKDNILNSPYNRRQNAQAEHITRGKIMSYDGMTLARTETDEEGNETRVYPYANEYAHVVGYTTHGKSGIESIANYELLTSHTNLIDQVIGEFRQKKSPGDTVVTTLNAGLMDAAYYALGDYRGAVVILDPKTGRILAMVSRPNFDPNTLAYVWDDMVADPSNSQLVNRATQGLYPPGSTFKIATALAYYRRYGSFEGFQYDCTGELTIDDLTVHCYKGAVHGEETLKDAFAHSCNTAFSEIGLMLGAQRLTAVADSLMFGEQMPTELYSSKSRWSLSTSSPDTELVQTAFGQGKTLVTPFHMALLVSAIANDGVLMKPYLIDHIENAGGRVISTKKPAAYRRLFSENEAGALTELMRAVVEEGSANELAWRSYGVAGKTGSAEYTKSDGSIGTHSWFVGFTNPDDPDLAIAVIAEDGGAGSTTAVPIASAIFRSYYGE